MDDITQRLLSARDKLQSIRESQTDPVIVRGIEKTLKNLDTEIFARDPSSAMRTGAPGEDFAKDAFPFSTPENVTPTVDQTNYTDEELAAMEKDRIAKMPFFARTAHQAFNAAASFPGSKTATHITNMIPGAPLVRRLTDDTVRLLQGEPSNSTATDYLKDTAGAAVDAAATYTGAKGLGMGAKALSSIATQAPTAVGRAAGEAGLATLPLMANTMIGGPSAAAKAAIAGQDPMAAMNETVSAPFMSEEAALALYGLPITVAGGAKLGSRLGEYWNDPRNTVPRNIKVLEQNRHIMKSQAENLPKEGGTGALVREQLDRVINEGQSKAQEAKAKYDPLYEQAAGNPASRDYQTAQLVMQGAEGATPRADLTGAEKYPGLAKKLDILLDRFVKQTPGAGEAPTAAAMPPEAPLTASSSPANRPVRATYQPPATEATGQAPPIDVVPAPLGRPGARVYRQPPIEPAGALPSMTKDIAGAPSRQALTAVPEQQLGPFEMPPMEGQSVPGTDLATVPRGQGGAGERQGPTIPLGTGQEMVHTPQYEPTPSSAALPSMPPTQTTLRNLLDMRKQANGIRFSDEGDAVPLLPEEKQHLKGFVAAIDNAIDDIGQKDPRLAGAVADIRKGNAIYADLMDELDRLGVTFAGNPHILKNALGMHAFSGELTPTQRGELHGKGAWIKDIGAPGDVGQTTAPFADEMMANAEGSPVLGDVNREMSTRNAYLRTGFGSPSAPTPTAAGIGKRALDILPGVIRSLARRYQLSDKGVLAAIRNHLGGFEEWQNNEPAALQTVTGRAIPFDLAAAAEQRRQNEEAQRKGM